MPPVHNLATPSSTSIHNVPPPRTITDSGTSVEPEESLTDNDETPTDSDDLYEESLITHLCFSTTSNAPYGEEVLINQNTIEALSIFVDLWHPSIYKFNSARREGFSLFALFNQLGSVPGKAMMKNWFLHPTRSLDILQDRLDLVEFFADNANYSIRENLKYSIKRTSSLRALLHRMRFGQITVKDWCKLYSTLSSMGEVVHVLTKYSVIEMPLTVKLAKRAQTLWTPGIIETGHELERVINFERSRQSNRFETNDGVDAEIDAHRARLQEITTQLQPAIEIEQDRCRNLEIELQPESIVTFMQRIGFMLKVSESDAELLKDVPNLEPIFNLNNAVFFKTPLLRSLDDKYGDPQSKIDDINAIIMHELQEQVLRVSNDIEHLISFCAELDCHITFGEIAHDNDYCRPTFNDKGAFDIRELRHPLVEHVCEENKFVPNDFLSGPTQRMKILTGPNASGKSIYLKSVCLAAFMAHIGSFVPAKSASFPLVDKILTRIKSIESVSSKMSTFVGDVRQMILAYQATPHSLIAIDEFGKGTQTSSGVSLLAASANYWLQQPAMPHVMIATHFLSLYKLLQVEAFQERLHYQHFRVHTLPAPDSTLPESQKFQHTYQLVDGHCESSLALVVAEVCGCDSEVIERAEQVIEALVKRQMPKEHTSEPYAFRKTKLIEIGKQLLHVRLDIDDHIRRYLNEAEIMTTHRRIEQ